MGVGVARPLIGAVAVSSLVVAIITGTGSSTSHRPVPGAPAGVPHTAAVVGETMPTGDVADSDPTADQPDDPMAGMDMSGTEMTTSGQAGMSGGQDAMTPGGQNGTRRTRHVPLAAP
jgi:hypothetical protein